MDFQTLSLDIACLFGANFFFDWKNPTVVIYVQIAFVIANLAYLGLIYLLPERIAAAKDETFVWVPEPKAKKDIWSQFMPNPEEVEVQQKLVELRKTDPDLPERNVVYTKKTRKEQETLAAQTALQESIGAAAQPLVFSKFMNIHVMLGISLLKIPLNIFRNPLIMKHFFGVPFNPNERPFGVLLREPVETDEVVQETSESIENSSSTTSNTGQGVLVSGGVNKKKIYVEDSEEAVYQCWESHVTEAEFVNVFESLKVEKGRDINYQTVEKSWTALMVVSGSVQYRSGDVKRLIELGADPALVDSEGCTAFHWAAIHDCAFAVEALCEKYGFIRESSKDKRKKTVNSSDDFHANANSLKRILSIKDKIKGLTAESLAEDSGSTASFEVLKEARTWANANSTKDDNEVAST